MGYDRSRFSSENVDEDLICPICSAVLENPLQAPECEHAFCSECIKQWLKNNNTCPVDRQYLKQEQLAPVPRILRNMLSRLSILCDNSQFGCTQVLKLDSLEAHCKECEFNPKRPVECDKCSVVIPTDELQDHNCIRDLRNYYDSEVKKLQAQCDELRSSMVWIRKSLRYLMPGGQSDGESLQESRVEFTVPQWLQLMPRARVQRWGGLISTPDSKLQEAVKNRLLNMGCPPSTVADLMENSHERKWPPGLCTLEIRQVNRPIFSEFNCRRVPGEQAVVIMYCENLHISEDMILDPGIVMIFAHGIG